ncbi:MAG: (d)CMP kinase [Actinomycetaceae bacterium]|nr:(d)CMP kinase [Actinomycetaceae bacterium]
MAKIPQIGSAEQLIPQIVRAISSLPTPAYIAIDGPSGSGKSTLARQLRQHFPDSLLLEVEEWAAGWEDLSGAVARLTKVVEDLRTAAEFSPLDSSAASADRETSPLTTDLDPDPDPAPVTTSRWDWQKNSWRKAEKLYPAPLTFLTGCASAALPVDLIIWIEAPEDIRRARTARRDSYNWSSYWDIWAEQEAEIATRFHSRENADFILST